MFRDHRRPKRLLTGLIRCGSCGGNLAATGQDYLACTAARSGAGCDNRTSVKRSVIERAVLEGLRDRLMLPDAVESFVKGFHAEMNRKRADDEILGETHKRELVQLQKRIDALIDAVAEGTLKGPDVGENLHVMKKRQAELRELISAAPAPAPRFHPKLAEQYRAEVERLYEALSNPEGRGEAAERLRRLVDHVTVKSDKHGQFIELTGGILMLLTLPGGNVPDPFKSSVQVVAGACKFHNLLFAARGLVPELA